MSKMEFSIKNGLYVPDNKIDGIIDRAVSATKHSMSRWSGENSFLATNYGVEIRDYDAHNKLLNKAIIEYCAEKANIVDNFDMENLTKDDVKVMFTNPNFEWQYFAIQVAVLDRVNAKNEVEDIMKFAEVRNLAYGDSSTFEIASKALYNVEDVGYGNNVSRSQQQFRKPIVVTPRLKEASVQGNIYQENALIVDFGREMAKVAMSFRVAMYDDVVTKIYDQSDLGTPFYKASFAKTTYMELASRVAAANGVSENAVIAYGTRVAIGKMGDTFTVGYNIFDELAKTGMVTDVYNVRTELVAQAVNSNTADYAFKVPNDEVILMPTVGDKPIKLVMEGTTFIEFDNGRKDTLQMKRYKYQQAWEVGKATQVDYGIQAV